MKLACLQTSQAGQTQLKPQSTKSAFTGSIKLWWLVSHSGNGVRHFEKVELQLLNKTKKNTR